VVGYYSARLYSVFTKKTIDRNRFAPIMRILHPKRSRPENGHQPRDRTAAPGIGAEKTTDALSQGKALVFKQQYSIEEDK